jgi:hypothetical protein
MKNVVELLEEAGKLISEAQNKMTPSEKVEGNAIIGKIGDLIDKVESRQDGEGK